jgi:hypothetical protein
MALEEPARSDALARLAQEGVVAQLRSRSGGEFRVRHGEHILVVPPTWKPFTAGHAIHILWYHGEQVDEQEG